MKKLSDWMVALVALLTFALTSPMIAQAQSEFENPLTTKIYSFLWNESDLDPDNLPRGQFSLDEKRGALEKWWAIRPKLEEMIRKDLGTDKCVDLRMRFLWDNYPTKPIRVRLAFVDPSNAKVKQALSELFKLKNEDFLQRGPACAPKLLKIPIKPTCFKSSLLTQSKLDLKKARYEILGWMADNQTLLNQMRQIAEDEGLKEKLKLATTLSAGGEESMALTETALLVSTAWYPLPTFVDQYPALWQIRVFIKKQTGGDGVILTTSVWIGQCLDEECGDRKEVDELTNLRSASQGPLTDRQISSDGPMAGSTPEVRFKPREQLIVDLGEIERLFYRQLCVSLTGVEQCRPPKCQ